MSSQSEVEQEVRRVREEERRRVMRQQRIVAYSGGAGLVLVLVWWALLYGVSLYWLGTLYSTVGVLGVYAVWRLHEQFVEDARR